MEDVPQRVNSCYLPQVPGSGGCPLITAEMTRTGPCGFTGTLGPPQSGEWDNCPPLTDEEAGAQSACKSPEPSESDPPNSLASQECPCSALQRRPDHILSQPSQSSPRMDASLLPSAASGFVSASLSPTVSSPSLWTLDLQITDE